MPLPRPTPLGVREVSSATQSTAEWTLGRASPHIRQRSEEKIGPGGAVHHRRVHRRTSSACRSHRDRDLGAGSWPGRRAAVGEVRSVCSIRNNRASLPVVEEARSDHHLSQNRMPWERRFVIHQYCESLHPAPKRCAGSVMLTPDDAPAPPTDCRHRTISE